MRRLQHPALVLLCLAWLVPGLIGHAPWKGGDGATFLRFLSMWQHGEWSVPGGSAPPLYFWLAALTAWLGAPLLALHDGARLASGVGIALGLFFIARAARALYGEEQRWAAVLALLGSVGLLLRGHEMNVYTAQFTGVAMVLDGLARLATGRPQNGLARWTVPAGLGVMLLATGLAEPLTLALLMLLLPLLIPAYRTETARRGLAHALLAASLVALVWIAWLWFDDQPLIAALQLQRWPATASGHRSTLKPFYVSGLLPWYLWPTWPLAGWALYRARSDWRTPTVLMPVLVFFVLFALASFSLGADEDKILSLTVPVALLAAAGVASLRRGAAHALLWFGIMLFSFLALVFWTYWSAHDLGLPARLARRLAKLGVEDIGTLRLMPFLLGAAATLIWMIFLLRARRTALRPLLVWSAGMSFVWVLLLSLFLDVLDPRLSYEQVGQDLRQRIPSHACVDARALGPQQRGLLAYHSERDLRTRAVSRCDWLLVQGKRREARASQAAHWVLQATLRRQGDREDRFFLYGRR